MRETPSYGTLCIRRTSKRILRCTQGRSMALSNAVTRRRGSGALQDALIPLNNCALDGEEGQADARLPVLGRLEDQVVQSVTD